MNILKRSLLYIKRKKNNLILLVILTILSFIALLSIAVFRGSQEAQKDIRESLGASFKMTVIINEDPAYREVTTLPNGGTITSYKGPLIDDQMIQKIMGHEGVVNYSVDNNWMPMYIEDISLFPGLYADGIQLANTDPRYAADLTEEEKNPM